MFGARRRARDEFRHTVHALTEAARTGDATAAAAAITRLGDLLPRLRRGDPAIDEAVPPVGQIAARLLGTAGPALGPALTVFRSLLTAAQFDAGLQAALLMSVGEDLLRSARETHERQLVDEAVKLGDAAVAAAEPGSQLQAVMLSMLGEACQLRFSNSGDAADLERALEAYRTAADRVTARVLPLRLTGDVRILCLSGLGSCLSLQFQQTADLRVLDEAITAYRRALRIVPPDDLSRPGYLDKLSIALHRRYQATGSADALNEAITLSAEAVETGVPDSTGYASWLHTHAISLLARHRLTDDPHDLERSISLLRNALRVESSGSIRRIRYCFSLGTALQELFLRCNDLAALDEAIGTYRDTLPGSLSDPHLSGMILSHLGVALGQHYEASGGPIEHLNEAITLLQEAVAVLPEDDPNRPATLANLAILLERRSRADQ